MFRVSSDFIANMAAPSEHMGSGSNQMDFSLKSGGSIVNTKVSFSLDSKWLFCCSGSVVKVYSTSSGECARVLSGHKARVTGVVVNPKIKLQVITCSVDQSIIVWDYEDGILLRRIQMSGELHGLYTMSQSENIYCLKLKSNKECQLVSHSSSERRSGKHNVVLDGCSLDHRQTSIGCEGRFAVSVRGQCMTVRSLQSQSDKASYTRHFLKRDEKDEFTCVMCHPVESMVATGCASGKIFLWYNISDERRVVRTCSHWHALPVADIAFTRDGSSMLSGGQECVLVKWQQNANKQDFLPRVGAPINHVACSTDNMFYTVSLDDNVILLLTSLFKTVQVYQGLTRSSLMRTALKNVQTSSTKTEYIIPVGLLTDPRSRCLVTNGKPGHLQFFSIAEDKHLYNLDIVGQNYVSPENMKEALTVTEVIQANFSCHGKWLATVEYWNDGIMSPELRLKFWKYVEDKQTYELNTSVESPHDDRVVSLYFRPPASTEVNQTDSMAVTSSPDGKFKIWVLMDDTDIYRVNNRWTCESVGFYRNRPAGDTSFSDDGSLLAVAFGSTITLWDPDTNVLKQTLGHSHHEEECEISHLEFGRQGCCQYLISCDRRQMTAWNLMSCNIQWSVDMVTSVITVDPMSDVMCVVDKDKNELYIFRPSTPTPIFSKTYTKKYPLISGAFIPKPSSSRYKESCNHDWMAQSWLYLMTGGQRLLTLEVREKDLSEKEKSKVILEQNLPQTALSVLMSQHRKSGVKVTDKGQLSLRPKGALKELLSSASHVQPSVTSLCQPFIRSLLQQKKTGGIHGNREEEEEEDDEDEEITSLRKSLVEDSDSDMDVDVDDQNVDNTPLSQSDRDRDNVAKAAIISVQDNEDLVQEAVKKSVDWYQRLL